MTSDRILAVMRLMDEIKRPSGTYWRSVRRAAETRSDSPENEAAKARGAAALLDIERAVRQWVVDNPEQPEGPRYGDTGHRISACIVNEERPAPYAAAAEALCGQTLYKILGPTPDGLAVCERCSADGPCAECGHPGYAHREGDSMCLGICLRCEGDDVDHDYRPAAERP